MGFAWPVILVSGIMFMPESPRWLAARGRNDEAQHAVARTRGLEDGDSLVLRETEEIKANVEYEKSLKSGWLDCFSPKQKILYRTLLGRFFPLRSRG